MYNDCEMHISYNECALPTLSQIRPYVMSIMQQQPVGIGLTVNFLKTFQNGVCTVWSVNDVHPKTHSFGRNL